ncbi:MAG: DUF4114 domain-containing protein, partial [Oscillatoriales cyanobacterium SM2_2_1]|nr:DUF4114 domain-containing protein [Oscillatoriales cyanobacterium SM2_2_1]
DAVLSGRTAESEVVFSLNNNTNLRVNPTAANTFVLNWEDGGDRDFNDAVITVRPAGEAAKGTRLQGSPSGSC